VQNVRILIPWASIEEHQGEYSWDYIDYIVESASNMGMGILGVINQTPAWAGDPILAGMPDPDVFGGFAQMVATRYAGQISAYEIWNEPNAINFLDPVDPAAYTALLQAAYPLMKQADPTITVIGGVVGAGASLGNVTMDPDDFVQGMYDAGAKGFFDALSFHPYEYSLEFSAGAGVAGSPLEQLQQILQIMADNGDSDLKVWATEYGQPTTGQYTEQQQADFIEDFLNAWSQMAGTGPMFIYTLQDTDSGSSNMQDNFGVYYSDGTAKQAVQAIIDYLNSIDPVDPGPTGPNHPVFQAIAAAVQWLGAATRTVITGLATAAVDVAKATGAVIRAVVQATCNLIRRGVAAAESVAKNIATATKTFVNNIRQAVHPSTSSTVDAEDAEPPVTVSRMVRNTSRPDGDDIAAEEQQPEEQQAEEQWAAVVERPTTSIDTEAESGAEPDSLQAGTAPDDEEDEKPSRTATIEREAELETDSEIRPDEDESEDNASASTPTAGAEKSDERSEPAGEDSSE
jgi:hypothetical protein